MYRVEALQTPVAGTGDPIIAQSSAEFSSEFGRGPDAVRHLKVLLVSGQPAVASKLERALRLMPWFEAQIIQAGTLDAARLAFTSDTFDVALVAGAESAMAIKEIATSMGACPVIAVSNAAGDSNLSAATAGAAAVLATRDIKARALETMIRQIVAG